MWCLNIFKQGEYHPKPAKATISNAMDVGDPSNFVRILELFNNEFGTLKDLISSYSISDDETKKTILEVKDKYQLPSRSAWSSGVMHHCRNIFQKIRMIEASFWKPPIL